MRPPRRIPLAAVLALLLVMAAVLGLIMWKKQNSIVTAPTTVPTAAMESAKAEQRPSNQGPQIKLAQTDDNSTAPALFREWLKRFQSADDTARAALIPAGRNLMTTRRMRMTQLIRNNPEQALREAVKLQEYEALPPELKPLAERPFSEVAPYNFYPVCNAPAGTPDHVADLSLADGRFDTYTYGRRSSVMSKRLLPVQGIALDGAAALHDNALRELEPEEWTVARRLFPNARNDTAHSFVSGQPITGTPVIALGGGRIYYLATRAELKQINDAMARLEDLPGPDAGSDVLYQAKPADASSAGFDFGTAQASEQYQADQWTETEKKVFIIRVDFSDLAGASHTQSATATNLNGVISDQIRAMSYGKTWIAAGVSANVYRMPQTSAYYVNGTTGSSLNSELLRDARNTFRTTRSGADAAINLGPVSASSNGDGGGLGDYHIVGVLFASMNMRSSITYAGLAGGSNLWMQGTIGAGTFTHEFGHNYGIGHSSFWQTSDGSVTGTGSSVEYGDPYDIMGGGDLPDGHFHPQAKARLNWLTASEWSDATTGGSGTYRLHRIDSQFTTGTPRGIRITRSAISGSEQYLWLGYRPLYAGIPHVARGAYMVWQQPGQGRSWLLDTTPATSGVLSDAPIPLGRTFADATSSSYITPLNVGGTGENAYLDVRVNFGPYPGNSPPTAGAIAGSATVAARSNAAYTITASDSNGDTLAYNWDTGSGSVPDNASSITQNWTVGGSYTLNATVSDMKGGTASATKNITVTDPLDTWTTGSVGSSEYLEQLVYAKGRFVAAEYFGSVFLSWDGVTWTTMEDPPDMDQPKLAYGANVFVVAGTKETASTTAQICWSPDGRRWNTATFPGGVPLVRALCFGNGRFTAVGDDGTVLSSTDGITWSVTTAAGTPDFRHIIWSGSSWVAVAMHPTNARPEVIWTSADGVTWTERSALGMDTARIVAHNGRCYATGWYGGVLYSSDHGITWQEAALPSGTRWSTWLIAAAPDGTLLCTARAMDESGTPNALLVSTDGLQWARAGGNGAVVNADELIFAAGRFYTVESAGVVRRSDTFYPANNAPSASFTTAPATGTARQPISFSASATDGDGDPLAFAWDFGAQFDVKDGTDIAPSFAFGGSYTITLRVSDGHGGTATLNHTITVTDPARTFTNRSVSSTIGDFRAIAAGGGRVVAVGSLFGGSFAGIRSWSTDGITWNTGNVGSNQHLYALVHDGTQFVGAGTRYDFTAPAGYRGWVATSPDGVTWTQRYWTGAWLNAIAHGGGVYVAAGDEGSVLRSTNGTSWSPVSISGITTGMTFEGLAWNGSVFLLTGYTGGNGGVKVFTSADGENWMDQAAGAGVASWQDLRKVAWLNDRFVGSGWYSKLRVSTNGGSSFTSTRSDTESTPALAYGNGIWFAAGVNQSNADADVDVLSLDGTNWFSYPAPTTVDRRAAIFFNNTLITVGNAGSIWQSDTLPAASSSFASWQSTHFPSGGVTSLATSDPDHDGLNNFAEYGLGLLPTAANGGIASIELQSGLGWMHFDMPEPARTDVRYLIQGSTSLTSESWTELARKNGTAAWIWQAGGTSRISTGTTSGGRLPTQIGMPDTQAGAPRYFMRLVMEQL